MSKLGKSYFVRLLRTSLITKEMANDLYEFIQYKLITELKRGNTINLFGIVNISPYRIKGKSFAGFMNCKIDDKGFRLRASINRSTKDYFRNLNKTLGGKIDYENSKLL